MAEGTIADGGGDVDLDIQDIAHSAVRESLLASLEPNGTAVLQLSLRERHADAAMPRNRLIEVTFDRGQGPDPLARQIDVLSRAFGSRDSTQRVEYDAAIKAASAAAREHLPELRKQFDIGLPLGESLLLKAPFKTTDGSNEYMWVEVTDMERREHFRRLDE